LLGEVIAGSVSSGVEGQTFIMWTAGQSLE
jgi:hypothetical protein